MVLFVEAELFIGSLGWVNLLVSVHWLWKPVILLTLEEKVSPYSWYCRAEAFGGSDFLSLLNHCNECCLTCVVVLVVMLTGYLPEMQNKHLMKLIMMIGIVNFSSEFLVKLLN